MGGNRPGAVLWVTHNGSGTREVAEATARELGVTARFCTHGELAEVLRGSTFALLGIELGQDPREGLALVREQHQRFPELVIVAASPDTSVPVLRAALEVGASDVLSLPLSAHELNKALIKFTEAGVKSPAPRGSLGDVITVYGARGGLGTTTLAVNLACRVKATAAAEVALVDLDLQRGDVAAFLNLAPAGSLAVVATAEGPLDDLLLASALTRHPSGVFVAPAPSTIEDAEAIGHDEVEAALGFLRARFRYVVIDTARTITGAILAAFEQSERILLVTDRSVPGVRAARRTLDLLLRLDTPAQRIEVLVTEATRGPLGLPDVVRVLGKEPLLVIPPDEAGASAAMNSGRPLNGRQSGLLAAISELAAKVSGRDRAAIPKPAPLLRRVLGRVGRTSA